MITDTARILAMKATDIETIRLDMLFPDTDYEFEIKDNRAEHHFLLALAAMDIAQNHMKLAAHYEGENHA